MAIVEVQNWRQIARDHSRKVTAVREVPLSPNVSSLRHAVTQFADFVSQNGGDLKTSMEAELEIIRGQLTELLKLMNSSHHAGQIRDLKDPMNILVTLATYLEQMLEPMRYPKLEGALHIVRYSGEGKEIFAVTFAPYSAPGGAMKPRIISGRDELVKFLTDDVRLGNDQIPLIFADLDRYGSVSWPQVQMSQDRMKELQLS